MADGNTAELLRYLEPYDEQSRVKAALLRRLNSKTPNNRKRKMPSDIRASFEEAFQSTSGLAITQRRRHLSYIWNHHEKLKGMFVHHDNTDSCAVRSRIPASELPLASEPMRDMASSPLFPLMPRNTVTLTQITPQLFTGKNSEAEEDALS